MLSPHSCLLTDPGASPHGLLHRLFLELCEYKLLPSGQSFLSLPILSYLIKKKKKNPEYILTQLSNGLPFFVSFMPFAHFYTRLFICYHLYNLCIIPFVTYYK